MVSQEGVDGLLNRWREQRTWTRGVTAKICPPNPEAGGGGRGGRIWREVSSFSLCALWLCSHWE